MSEVKNRCWDIADKNMLSYHDKEWGVPVHSDKKLFEFLILEGAQAGLNWTVIFKKRPGYRKAFDNFDFNKISKYSNKDIKRLLKDPGIVRNRLKIKSAVENAKVFLDIRKEFGTFDKYIWSFVNYKPINNKFKTWHSVPGNTKVSDKISKDLKGRGMSFVGSTIIYAFMQAVGITNDHLVHCFRHKEISKKNNKI